jgi:hypothetical protein
MAYNPKSLANLKPCGPGVSGNPAGRAKGSRNKLNQAYIDAFCQEFEKHGEAVFAKVRKKFPHIWLRLAAELQPKQVQVEHGLSDMTDDQLRERIAELNAAIANELAVGVAPRADGPDPGTPPSDTRH